MCMGLGCNTVGVTGCRIMPTREEKLIAISTNAMIPCNGRFPMLLAMGTVLLGRENDLLLALLLTAAVCLGACGTFAVSFLLSKLLHRKPPAPFVLELPPYRRPQPKKILTDAIFGKTLHVLSRGAGGGSGGADPVGAVHGAGRRHEPPAAARANADGAGELLGMNGAILIGFLFALPANELAIPVILMLLTRQSLGTAPEAGAAAQLAACGVGAKTAFCCLIFSVFHWPCATTLQAIRRETGESSVDTLSAALPTGRRRPAVPARQLARPIDIKNTLHGCAACFVYESK